MKNNLPLAVFAASGLLLTACAQYTNMSKPATTQTEQCLQIQREMVFRASDHNHDATSITRQQQQAYTAHYQSLCK